MKKIEAIIRKSKFETIKRALYEAGIEWFSYWDITGHGKSAVSHMVKGQVFHSNYLQRYRITIVVHDDNLDKTVKAVMAARSGKKGDGKIFVSDVENIYRIRTGETGQDALFN